MTFGFGQFAISYMSRHDTFLLSLGELSIEMKTLPEPRLLGVLGWGLWIVQLGLPALGWSFAVIALIPGWPYAFYDLVHLGFKEAGKS